ncbi:MAG: HupE/UreJ family protein [Myxococcales bacterium]|nr:HupE/UreJ family protein [Myxococcales bacterium]
MRTEALLATALLPIAAVAHQATVSYSELDVHGREITGELRFALADVRNQPAGVLLDSYVVKSSGQPCALQPGARAAPDGEDGISIKASWICPAEIEEVSVRVEFLDWFPIGATHLSRIGFGPDEISQRAVQVEEPTFEARRSRSVGEEFWRFLRLGIEHIFTGYDHIAFLIGLLLLGGRLGELVKIVTAFTVAHSITLALAALNVFAPSPRVVEPLIAASIVFIGVENLWALRKRAAEKALRHRWMVTLGFGLVHGFGFASVLRGLDLPRNVLATGLVSFNLGVEVGQVCIVVIALPLVRRLHRFAAPLSAIVAVLGAFWLVQRLAG